MPRLHHFTLCPFSRRIRLALAEYGVDAELVPERPWAPGETLLALNPAGALPVLVEDDGAVIAGVEAISEYLEETRGAPLGRPLIGREPLARAEVRRLVAWFDVKFNAEVSRNILEQKVIRRFARARSAAPEMAAIRSGLDNIRRHLDYVGALAAERNWLAGDTLSNADLAAAAHLSCIDYLGDVPWSANEEARAWYARVKSRPAFRPLLADHVSGIEPPRSYADLDF